MSAAYPPFPQKFDRRSVTPTHGGGGMLPWQGGRGGSDFDHAAFDPKTRRVFIAHTARDCIEVIDHDAKKHIATLPGFPGVAGAVADEGEILTTNRGAPEGAWLMVSGMGAAYCFAHFFLVLPLVARVERPRPLPISIRQAVLPATSSAAP